MDISRMPVTAISSVRGIGVADRLSTSTLVRSAFNVSLCSTPKRCSSSMMTSPRSLNLTFGPSSLCVPITTSTEPSSSPSMVSLISLVVWKRLIALTSTGNPSKRSVNVSKCCCTSNVVGTSTATCLESCTALNAARTAISVLPNPTSPQIRRSIGTGFSISDLTSSMVVS